MAIQVTGYLGPFATFLGLPHFGLLAISNLAETYGQRSWCRHSQSPWHQSLPINPFIQSRCTYCYFYCYLMLLLLLLLLLSIKCLCTSHVQSLQVSALCCPQLTLPPGIHKYEGNTCILPKCVYRLIAYNWRLYQTRLPLSDCANN